MLILNAEIDGRSRADLRLDGPVIAAIGGLAPEDGETVIEAAGAALFPGLHDHHIHLAAYAVSLSSLICGPPDIRTAAELAERLAAAEGEGWLRGILYHESVGGALDRAILDRIVPDRPLRIQHRSGRLWIFNSAGLALLKPAPGDPLEREGGALTGRLYDADGWLRTRLGGRFPSLAEASRALARQGVTGVTDTTASNGPEELGYFFGAQDAGELLQSVLVMGDDGLNGEADVRVGPRKFHLHDAALPDFDQTVAAIRGCHAAGRAAAFHCVTEVDLTFALAALEEAGARAGDRIEHASVAPPSLVPLMRRLGVTVVTQPHFIFERGDRYLAEEPAENHPWLYRAQGLAGIPLAGGSDAPFGAADPWAAMAAAVQRRTRGGHIIGAGEALSPEEALDLFLGPLEDPGGARRRVVPGAPADLVLIDRCWAEARSELAAVNVRLTLKAGRPIFGA
jgi:predicted amidohydrolase YtcJ